MANKNKRKNRSDNADSVTVKAVVAPSNDSRVWIISLLLALLAFLLYANTIQNGFLLDDTNIITHNEFVKKGVGGIPEILSSEYRAGYWVSNGNLYRPLPLVIFAALWEMFPSNPAPFHFISCLVFALTALLMFTLLRRMLPATHVFIPAMITLLFIVHPIHTEVVANIKSLDELLSLLFALAGCYAVLKFVDTQRVIWLTWLAISYFLALASKEGAITFLVIFPLVIYFFTSASRADYIKVMVICVIPAIVYLLIRNYILTHQTGHPYTLEPIDNAIVGARDLFERTASCFQNLGKYVWMSFVPYPLSIDYSFNQIPLVRWGDIRAITSLLVYIGAAGIAVYRLRKREAWVFAIIFFMVTISLYSNLFFTIGINFAERVLYIPSFGICILLVLLLRKLNGGDEAESATPARWMAAVVLLLALTGSLLTFARNRDWKDHLTIYRKDIESTPQSAHLNFWYGNEIVMDMKKRNVPAEQQAKAYQLSNHYLSTAITIYPGYADAYAQRGRNYYKQGRMDSAESDYRNAVKYKVAEWSVYSNLAIMLAGHNQPDSALLYLRRAAYVDARQAVIYKNMGNVHHLQGRYEEALLQYREALARATPEEAALVEEIKRSITEAGQQLATTKGSR